MADLIERQTAIDAHCELCPDQEKCYRMDLCPDVEVFRLLPSAQPELAQNLHNACTDLISRQAAIDALDVSAEALRRILDTVDIVGAEREKYKLGLGLIESCISDIKELTSAQPELGKNTMPEQPQMDKLGIKTGETCTDVISRQAAIDVVVKRYDEYGRTAKCEELASAIEKLPSAQPEQPTEVQDILQYLDGYLHPIVSPEHWSVYSELYDMVSMLPSAQPEIVRCKDCKYSDENWRRVSVRWLPCMDMRTGSNWFCGSAERKTDG